MAVMIGYKPSEFWEMTQAELIIASRVHNDKQKEKTKELRYLPYMISYLLRIETLPDYDEWMEVKEKKTQTDDDMVTMARLLNALYGGEEVVI